MAQKGTEIPQIKEEKVPADCPVPPPCPVCPPKPKPTQILLKILLVLGMALFLAVLILVGSGLRISQKESLLDIWLASRRGISPTPEVLATPTPDLTDWKTYTNERYGYSLKYPQSWFLHEASTAGIGGVDILYSYGPPKQASKDPNFWQGKLKIDIGKILQEKKENQDLEEWLTEYEKQLGPGLYQEIAREKITLAGREALKQTRKFTGSEQLLINYFVGNGNYVYFVSINGDFNPKNSELLNQILSTFKFLDGGSLSSGESKTVNYPKPSSWKTVNNDKLGISICLPPKWEWNLEGRSNGPIVFNRDPAYRPDVAYFDIIDYKGGSRREEYIDEHLIGETDPEEMKRGTTVKEININGRSVLDIAIPSFPRAFVFVLGDKIYAVEEVNWNLVNDSREAFLKDIYTMIGCINLLK